jgi:quinol monooxygenase YgiN
MFVVVAEIKVKEGMSNAFYELIVKHAESSVAQERGCRRFDVCQAEDDPSRFLLYEVYADTAAFDEHTKTDRFSAFFQKAGSMLAAQPELRRFNRTGSYQ